MGIMARGDDNSVDVRILENAVVICASLRKAELLAEMNRAYTASAHDAVQLRTRCLKRWNQHPSGIIACAQKRNNTPRW